MFKRTIAAIMILAATLCLAVKVDAADAPLHTKNDTWLVYMYICGTDLEENSHVSTKNIAEMQHVKLPSNVKILIAAGGANKWYHPTIKANGDGIYLYSSNRLEKQAGWNANANMSDPKTLASFLKYGEDNFSADHRILIFRDHGGVSGICYDSRFAGDSLTYDELKSALTAVYGNSPEEVPFELIGFGACMTGSYELANSIADFSRYMIGSECSEYGWYFTPWIAALANDPSLNGAQIGKAICDSAMNSYGDVDKRTNTFSVIDLTKMPELREAYEAYFNAALKRSNEETGFSGAFARAAENRNVDKFSNVYTDLGLLAKNTKSIMPKESKRLLKAIDRAVVYNKRGDYLKSKGLSTYYPYVSTAKIFSKIGDQKAAEEREKGFKIFSKQNSSYSAQKEFYGELLDLDLSNLQGENKVLIERQKDHLVAKLTPEQMESVSSINCVLFPLSDNGGYDIGGAVLFSADDLKIDWKKGIVTENFRAMEPILDGQKIVMYPSVSGRGHTFYTVPVLVGDDKTQEHLLVRYDTATKKYEIVGFGSMIENGMVRDNGGKPAAGIVFTPLHVTISSDPSNEVIGLTGYKQFNKETQKWEFIPLMSVIDSMTIPNTNEKLFIKWKTGEPFVYTRDSAITSQPIKKGVYSYSFMFAAPNGDIDGSYPGVIAVKNGQILRFTTEEFAKLLAESANK